MADGMNATNRAAASTSPWWCFWCSDDPAPAEHPPAAAPSPAPAPAEAAPSQLPDNLKLRSCTPTAFGGAVCTESTVAIDREKTAAILKALGLETEPASTFHPVVLKALERFAPFILEVAKLEGADAVKVKELISVFIRNMSQQAKDSETVGAPLSQQDIELVVIQFGTIMARALSAEQAKKIAGALPDDKMTREIADAVREVAGVRAAAQEIFSAVGITEPAADIAPEILAALLPWQQVLIEAAKRNPGAKDKLAEIVRGYLGATVRAMAAQQRGIPALPPSMSEALLVEVLSSEQAEAIAKKYPNDAAAQLVAMEARVKLFVRELFGGKGSGDIDAEAREFLQKHPEKFAAYLESIGVTKVMYRNQQGQVVQVSPKELPREEWAKQFEASSELQAVLRQMLFAEHGKKLRTALGAKSVKALRAVLDAAQTPNADPKAIAAQLRAALKEARAVGTKLLAQLDAIERLGEKQPEQMMQAYQIILSMLQTMLHEPVAAKQPKKK